MNKINLGERIAKARKKSGMTQKELSDLLGLTVHAIRKWEQDTNKPSLQILQKIARVTDSSFAYLVGAHSVLHEAIRGESCQLHHGVETLKRSEQLRQLWSISDAEISMLRRWTATDPKGNPLYIETIPQAIALLRNMRSLYANTQREEAE